MTCITLRPALLPAIAFAILASVSSVSAQDSERPGFLDSIFGNSDRVSPSTPQTQSGRAVAQGAGSDLVVRIDRLESQIRQLTGAIEQLQYRNQQLEAEVHDLRGGAPRPTPQARPGNYQGPAATPPATGRRSDAFDPTQHPNAPGAPHTLGSITSNAPAQSSVAEEAPAGAAGSGSTGAPLDLSTLAGRAASAPVTGTATSREGAPGPRESSPNNPQVATLPPSDSPKDNYDLAYGYVLRRDYALAESGFRAFLQKFPNDRLTPDAQYWLGESLFQRQQFREAAEAFLTVSTKYETASKAPDALLRLGQSLAALGEKEAACASLGEVLRKYPRASVAIKQGVDREQKRVHC